MEYLFHCADHLLVPVEHLVQYLTNHHVILSDELVVVI
jgi:hypothetical protein